MFLIVIKWSNVPSHRFEGSTMGTFYTVTYRGDRATNVIKSALEDHLSTIEDQLSNWKKNSWIRRFNRRETTSSVSLPDHAYEVLRHSLRLARHTNGALDPTLGALINLWGFGPFEEHAPFSGAAPDAQAIQEALQASGSDKLVLTDAPPRIAKTHPALRLNFSAVAKGYAVDVLAQHLESKDITDYMINIGGELRTNGHPQNADAWTISIQRPTPDARDGTAYRTVNLNAAGVATSGDYRRFRTTGDRQYSHLLDPETGRPVQSDLASVTVIASTSAQADGLATACLVLGLQEARDLIARTPNAEGIFIQRVAPGQFRTSTSSGWPKGIRSVSPNKDQIRKEP